MNNNANIKQFQLLKFINDNCIDDHVISKISIVLRRDKIEAPYYMITKIRMSTCIDRFDNGLIHAMDTLNHTRQHNLTEDNYDEIKAMILDTCPESEVSEGGEEINLTLMSKDDDEFNDLFEIYKELFEKLDNLTD